MNRLILIGNGFDLAHGMKTNYKDFIEHLWFGIYKDLENEARKGAVRYTSESRIFRDSNNLVEITYSEIGYNHINGYLGISNIHDSFDINISKERISASVYSKYIRDLIAGATKMRCGYTNSFFEIITNNYTRKNWSDIEADYYKELLANRDSETDVKNLNKDFDQIKKMLKYYLASLEKPHKLDKIEELIYSPVRMRDIKIDSFGNFKKQLTKHVQLLSKVQEFKNWFSKMIPNFAPLDIIDRLNDTYSVKIAEALLDREGTTESNAFFRPSNVLLLNFNYTETDTLYIEREEARIRGFYLEDITVNRNSIHGTISPDDNHMIFGYGDEEADEYKELEKSETLGLLDNVKSINYLKTSNYRDLERFIESDSYQIFIMGMSCGMADRTILRKLFQHENCISIKPFFYEKMNDEKEIEWDNYTELVQNISRCFSDKDLLRSTVVNKVECLKLPQYND
ncbi:MAG: AbiH family protein [Dysgonomonas mossii]|uniref:AbiH family protein n=1 Tax=Dysgonomonas mossii TaxID=163665 RepID=UPI0039968A81